MELPRLSRTERLILELLADEEKFGLQIVEDSKGALKRGTVYVTLRSSARPQRASASSSRV